MERMLAVVHVEGVTFGAWGRKGGPAGWGWGWGVIVENPVGKQGLGFLH